MLEIQGLLASGIWAALPVLGTMVLGRSETRSIGTVAWFGLTSAVGLAVLSPPLLLAAELGIYRPAAIGLVGWGIVILATILWLRRGRDEEGHADERKSPDPERPAPSQRWWGGALAVGFLGFGGLVFGFPSESILGGVDQGVYANTAVFLAREGHLRIPIATVGLEDPPPAGLQLPGYRQNVPDPRQAPYQTPQFGHLFPVWLAQGYASAGAFGLFGVCGLFGMISLACFFRTAVAWVGYPLAVAATLVLAFNPAQLWIARITLSENLAQVFIWAALALLAPRPGPPRSKTAAWAGFVLGISALARIDGFVFVPLLLIAQFTSRVLGGTSRVEWRALFLSAVPTFAGAIMAYAVWSEHYFAAMERHLAPVAVGTLGVLSLWLLPTRIRRLLGAAAASREMRALLIVLLGVVAFWSYSIRPNGPRLAEPAGRASTGEQEITYLEHLQSVPNLVSYISLLVAILAVVGLSVEIWRVLGGRRSRRRLTYLVLWGGLSTAYLADPWVDPYHFWAVRRFTPLVLPGFFLLAACGWRWVARQLPPRIRPLAGGALLLATVVHTVSSSASLAFFSRDAGVFEQVRVVADHLPEDDVVLAPVFDRTWPQWVTPLGVAFGHRVHPVDATRDKSHTQRVLGWIDRERSAGRPVHLVVRRGRLPETWTRQATWLGRFEIERRVFRPTLKPLPKEITKHEIWLDVYRLEPR